MASTEFEQESRHSSHSSIDLYPTSAKANLQFVSDRKCAVDSRPRIDRFCPAQGRMITPEQEGAPKHREYKGKGTTPPTRARRHAFDLRGEKTGEV